VRPAPDTGLQTADARSVLALALSRYAAKFAFAHQRPANRPYNRFHEERQVAKIIFRYSGRGDPIFKEGPQSFFIRGRHLPAVPKTGPSPAPPPDAGDDNRDKQDNSENK
jgi:hypothetical protein